MGSVSCQTSWTMTWMAPAAGMASSAPTNAPKIPPIQLPMSPPIRMDSSTSSGLTRTVRLITIGFSTWFSSWV